MEIDILEFAVPGFIVLAFSQKRVAVEVGDRVLAFAYEDTIHFIDFADSLDWKEGKV